LFNLFGDSGQRWDFHSVVARNNGADVQRAWRVLTEHNLWERSADNMPPPTQPIGARFGRRSPYEIMRDADDLRSVL
jgi:hypothetical protein